MRTWAWLPARMNSLRVGVLEIGFSSLTARTSPSVLAQLGFGTKNLKSDGHLITEDSVLPTTAPGGAPEQNRCYQTPATLLVLPPCARFARALGAPRTAHYATPPLGAGAVGLMSSWCRLRLQ